MGMTAKVVTYKDGRIVEAVRWFSGSAFVAAVPEPSKLQILRVLGTNGEILHEIQTSGADRVFLLDGGDNVDSWWGDSLIKDDREPEHTLLRRFGVYVPWSQIRESSEIELDEGSTYFIASVETESGQLRYIATMPASSAKPLLTSRDAEVIAGVLLKLSAAPAASLPIEGEIGKGGDGGRVATGSGML